MACTVSSYPGDPRLRNADYGSGVYRRRIALNATVDGVLAEMEDNQHGFRLRLNHDGESITALEAEVLRYPFNTCPGAVEPLRALIGTPLDIDVAALRRIIEPGFNCTHLYDLATLALAQQRRGLGRRMYDVVVPDERDGETSATVALDGVSVHRWRIREQRLVAPAALAGESMMSGYFKWTSRCFGGDALEAAQVIQRGYFVAQARRYDFKNSVGAPASDDNMPQGSCYSYNHGVVEQAVRTGTTRDFSDCAEALLQFNSQ